MPDVMAQTSPDMMQQQLPDENFSNRANGVYSGMPHHPQAIVSW